jgi:hypothetical protein
MDCKPNTQPSDSSVQSLIPLIPDLDRQMRVVWELDMQQEHLAIALRAHELFVQRGCQEGHDWEDWFRAELELHLNE